MKHLDLARVAPRLALMVGGEAMQSACHFALNLALLRVLSAHEYGVFAIAMVIGGLSLTYIRSLTAMPASIWIGRSRTRQAAGAYEVTFGSGAVLLSLVTAGGVAVLLRAWISAGAIEGGCFIGLWSLRNHIRTAFFALGRTRLVSASDLVFTLCGAVVTVLSLWTTGDLLQRVFFGMALANGLGIVIILVGSRRPVRVSLRRSVRLRYRGLRKQLSWSFVSVTMTNLQGQATALLVAAIAGPAAYAPIAAVLMLFVPLRVAAAALVNMIQPELSALLGRGDVEQVWRQSKIWGAIMGAGGVAYGSAMIFLLPFVKSQALENTPIYLIGFFAWAIYAMTMLYVMPRVVLEVMAAFRVVAMITAAGAIVGIGIIEIVLAVAPPAWALAGGAASEVIVLVASWVCLRRLLAAMPAGGGPLHRGAGGLLRTAPVVPPFQS